MNRDYFPSDTIRRTLGMRPESSFEQAYRKYVSEQLSKEQLDWYWKDVRGQRLDLFDNRPISLLLRNMQGVYIIWHEAYGGIIRKAVYVGQGNIGQRLSEHRNDWNILRHWINQRVLYVAYAFESSENRRLGVENYLHDNLKPLESNESSDQQPIPVRLPWELVESNEIKWI